MMATWNPLPKFDMRKVISPTQAIDNWLVNHYVAFQYYGDGITPSWKLLQRSQVLPKSNPFYFAETIIVRKKYADKKQFTIPTEIMDVVPNAEKLIVNSAIISDWSFVAKFINVVQLENSHITSFDGFKEAMAGKHLMIDVNVEFIGVGLLQLLNLAALTSFESANDGLNLALSIIHRGMSEKLDVADIVEQLCESDLAEFAKF